MAVMMMFPRRWRNADPRTGHYFGMTEEEIDVVEEIWRQDEFVQDGSEGGDEGA